MQTVIKMEKRIQNMMKEDVQYYQKMRIKEEKMTKVLIVEYEVFEDIGETVLTVVDREKDEALNMFNGENADKMYKLLVGKDIKEK